MLTCFRSRPIPHEGSLTVEIDSTGCEGTENYIRYLEHVEVVLSLSFTRRGDLTIYITSPQGTRSTLLSKRRMDYSSRGFKNWAFMSTHSWEENPRGKWKLEIKNAGEWMPHSNRLACVQLCAISFHLKTTHFLQLRRVVFESHFLNDLRKKI